MNDLPQPLTPPDCELQDFAFMPLDVSRLRDSELASNETPEACWAAVLIWCASWHQVPAASIPDDEQWIAKQAHYANRGRIDPEWSNVRAGALRGWIKCADGRMYHPVVAEKALDAWKSKLEQRWRSEVARIKKHNQRHNSNLYVPDFDEWVANGRPQGQPLPVPRDNGQCPEDNGSCPPDRGGDTSSEVRDNPGDNGSKRQREGQGQGQREGQGQGQGQGENIKPESSTLVPGGVKLPPHPDDDDGQQQSAPAPNRAVQIAVLLRGLGVRPLTSAHPKAHEWAANPKLTDQLLRECVASARDYKPEPEPISPNYLDPIITKALNPPPPKHDNSWRASDQATDAKARELGIVAPLGWTYAQLRDRIQQEIDKRRQSPASPEGAAA